LFAAVNAFLENSLPPAVPVRQFWLNETNKGSQVGGTKIHRKRLHAGFGLNLVDDPQPSDSVKNRMPGAASRRHAPVVAASICLSAAATTKLTDDEPMGF